MLSFRCCRLPLVVLILFFFVSKGNGLLITQIIVPTEIKYGTNVGLRCLYDLDGYSLYSVKWYKGSHEFFRFVPNEVPKFRLFPWSNFTIDYDPKEMGKVYLMGVTQEAEGKYKCEVSTEGPKFDTDFKEANMSVYDVASKGPILSADARNEFKLNRVLNFTCSFKKSRPKPKLTWSIGGKNAITTETRYVMESPGGVEWWSVESDISVRTTASHLQKKMVAVACQAQVGSVYQETATLNYTGSESFKNKRGDSFSVDVVSASMASSHHEPNKGLRRHTKSEGLLLIVALSALLS